MLWFADKLDDIAQAIKNELTHYERLKNEKKEYNRNKKKMLISQENV